MKNNNQSTKPLNNPLDFLDAKGEMVELVKQKDWSSTLVGCPSQWPQSLKTSLGIILGNKFPMFIFWGKESVCFYNDAYRPSLGIDGKHPSILGERGATAWAEIWDVIGPLLDQVRDTGIAHWSEDQLIPIYRNGTLENVYWTFSYSPIRDETKNIAGILVTCNETTDKVLNLNKLKESEDQLRFAIEAAELGTWDYDLQTGRVVLNKRLQNWLGLKTLDLLDIEILTERIIDADKQKVVDALDNALDVETPGNFDMQFTVENKRTSNRIIVRSKGRVWFKNNSAYRFNGTVQDVTVQAKEHSKFLQETNRTLQLYIDNLKKSNEELEAFAYVSSHDLQEPLRKIIIFISRILERENLQGIDASDFDRIKRSAERMRQLITDLLNYSRISGKSSDKQIIDLNEIIDQVEEDLSEIISGTEAKIKVANLEKVRAVPYQMRQLFNNLISNAVKFAKEEENLVITIKGEYLQTIDDLFEGANAQNGYYKISVSDNGIGFDSENTQRMFEVFQKLHPKSKYGGTGIGLSIVKKIANAHNGYIRAFGEPNEGATFEIYLPMQK
ncbi:sensor histidine kinase [Winogradskyella ursingii]|uniref:sensor histidine kinase n=1 Tax=Winogradskyella ursingii TaxID=2686079 RepID=UPI0015CA4360|nr:PAS domain-containing sensor histidine kinase [Winogradskyella ursingii]